jgi:hypothetical protein
METQHKRSSFQLWYVWSPERIAKFLLTDYSKLVAFIKYWVSLIIFMKCSSMSLISPVRILITSSPIFLFVIILLPSTLSPLQCFLWMKFPFNFLFLSECYMLGLISNSPFTTRRRVITARLKSCNSYRNRWGFCRCSLQLGSLHPVACIRSGSGVSV